MKRNILLLFLGIALSFLLAPYFGSWYNFFSPQESSAFWGPDKETLITFLGFFFSYTFFTILLLELFGHGRRRKWFGWLIVPPAILFLIGDLGHIYLPIGLALIAWGLAVGLRKIFGKAKHSNI